jgi:hypothetical protein
MQPTHTMRRSRASSDPGIAFGREVTQARPIAAPVDSGVRTPVQEGDQSHHQGTLTSFSPDMLTEDLSTRPWTQLCTGKTAVSGEEEEVPLGATSIDQAASGFVSNVLDSMGPGKPTPGQEDFF